MHDTTTGAVSAFSLIHRRSFVKELLGMPAAMGGLYNACCTHWHPLPILCLIHRRLTEIYRPFLTLMVESMRAHGPEKALPLKKPSREHSDIYRQSLNLSWENPPINKWRKTDATGGFLWKLEATWSGEIYTVCNDKFQTVKSIHGSATNTIQTKVFHLSAWNDSEIT